MEVMHGYDEKMQLRYTGQGGMYGREALALQAGVWNDNGTLKDWALGTTGTVGFKLITTTMLGLQWEATADQTDRWYYPWQVPFDYKRDGGETGKKSRIVLRVKARKVDAASGATDNTDLALTVQAFWHNSAFSSSDGSESAGDTAVNTLTTAVSNTLNALASSGDEDADPENFRWYNFDITGAMSAAQLAALTPGATMTFSLYPNEAPGTGIAVDVLAIEVVYTRHAMPDAFRRATAFG